MRGGDGSSRSISTTVLTRNKVVINNKMRYRAWFMSLGKVIYTYIVQGYGINVTFLKAKYNIRGAYLQMIALNTASEAVN